MAPFLKRLILTAVALPVVYALSAVLTGWTHLAMAVTVTLVMAAGAAETGALLGRAGMARSPVLLPIAAGSLPAVAWLETAGHGPPALALAWVTIVLGAILAHTVAAGEKSPLAEGLGRVSAHITQLLYPALFGSFIVRIAGLPDASAHYVLFFLLVFTNDIAAYLAGKAFRGRTALNLKVSPGKTAVGFAAGLVFAVGTALGAGLLLPGYFPGGPLVMAALGILTALATFLGDLAESALKRSAGVKDSGLVMLGRGGILDSVDSLVMSAPVFYLFIRVLRGA